jgi:SAM-dependent methyltransferase
VTTPETAQRASSFGSVAEAYDRFRPGPPLSAVDWILRSTGATAADLGAGTGALTRQLAQRADRVVAVEPDGRMLEVLKRSSPEAGAIRGKAEQLPIRSATLDAVLVSSAWHWMDPDKTVAEVGRVLRPGGVFGVIRNGPDRSVDWVSGLLGVRNRSSADEKERARRHRLDLPPQAPFVDLENCSISWSLPMTRDELVGLAGTYSSTIVMAPEQRERELARVRETVESAVGEEGVVMPMLCRCWRTVRR